MGLYLKELSKEDGKEIFDMLQEINQNDNGFHNEVYGTLYEEFKIWLDKNEGYSKQIGWKMGMPRFWKREHPSMR